VGVELQCTSCRGDNPPSAEQAEKVRVRLETHASVWGEYSESPRPGGYECAKSSRHIVSPCLGVRGLSPSPLSESEMPVLGPIQGLLSSRLSTLVELVPA
jgi:hypothetical protein